MKKFTDNIYKEIGRKIFIKYLVIIVSILLFAPIILFSIYGVINRKNGSGFTYAKNLLNDIIENFPLLIFESVILIITIWTFSYLPVKHIIKNNGNPFWTSFTAIILIWIMLFISTELFEGIMHSMSYGIKAGFEAAVFDWFAYAVFIWSVIAISTGLLMSLFLGKEIKRQAIKIQSS